MGKSYYYNSLHVKTDKTDKELDPDASTRAELFQFNILMKTILNYQTYKEVAVHAEKPKAKNNMQGPGTQNNDPKSQGKKRLER